MARTPEGAVKDDIKKVLDARPELYYFMPVQGGYGKRGLDFFICYRGRFIAIEVKRPGGEPKRFQADLIETIRTAFGLAMSTDNVEDVVNLLNRVEGNY